MRLSVFLLFIFFFVSAVMADSVIDSPLVREFIDSEVKKQVDARAVSATPGMRVAYFLKSRFLGAVVWYVDQAGQVVGRGPVQAVMKRDDGYEVTVYDALLNSMVQLKVVFEGDFGTGPTAKRRELELAKEMARKRTYDAEKQMSVSLAPLMGMESSSAAFATQFSEPSVEAYPEGEMLLAHDRVTNKQEKVEVIIFRGAPILADGTPLKIRLERI